MDELWLRVVLVGTALVVTAAVSYLLARRSGTKPRRVNTGSMEPGVYLFTSATCADCAPAREKLRKALGDHGFHEVSWEDQPRVLQDLGVDAVPATLIVGEGGWGTLYPGRPDRAIAGLGP